MGREAGPELAQQPEPRTLEGLPIRAEYTDRPCADEVVGWPGRAPFRRGSRAERDERQPWRILERLPDADAEQVRSAALAGLQGGAGGLQLPACSARWSAAEWARALEGVGLAGIALHGACLPAAPRPLREVFARAAAAGADLADSCLGVDPLRAAREEGAAALDCAAACGARGLLADAEPFHDAGAHAALELGLLLAATAHALRAHQDRAAPAALFSATAWRLPMERDFFGGVVKLRAARLVWSALIVACGAAPPPPFLHACGSRRTLTRRDPHSNLVRATVQAAAAAVGGADAISLPAFDEAGGAASPAGRRLARNVALVVEHEARLLEVQDPAGGSAHVEERSEALARAAWEEFRALEAAGGVAAALADGRLRARLDAEWRRRAERLRSGEEVLIGVNRHAAPTRGADPAPLVTAHGWPLRREEEACDGATA